MKNQKHQKTIKNDLKHHQIIIVKKQKLNIQKRYIQKKRKKEKKIDILIEHIKQKGKKEE